MSEVQKNVAAALEQLKTLQAKMHAYHHAMSMIYYDSVTTAPEGTDEGRGETLSILSGESHALFASPETDAMLKTLEANSDALTPEIRRQAELLRRNIWITRSWSTVRRPSGTRQRAPMILHHLPRIWRN